MRRPTMPRATAWLAAAVLVPACGGGPAAPSASQEATALHEVLARTQSRYGLPAVAGIVVRGDRVLGLEVLGVRKLGEAAQVTVDDRFHYGSNVKAMTATVLAMLVEQGRLGWTNRPRDVFPERVASFHPALTDVTLEQILSHRAGIVPLESLEDVLRIPPLEGEGVQQRLAFTVWALGQPPTRPPGQYAYSNGGYAVAAAMAERASGESWEALMTMRLFGPLGIQAGFGWPAQDDPSQPWGHVRDDGRLVPHDPTNPAEQIPAYLLPAGGLSTSIDGYGRFLQLHLRGLLGESMLLRADTFRRLHAPVGGDVGNGSRYALGWGVRPVNGVPTSFHDGSTGTFYVSAALQADRDVAVAVVTNAGGEDAARGCGTAVLQLLDRYSSP